MLAVAELYFLIFFTYAVLGWCMEVGCKLVQYRRFINRGFLIGPYCPIYGVGALGISLLLARYVGDPAALFCMSMILCSILEYFTSWAMEKLFHARWWDYSQRRFNLNGRICLNTMVPFGLLGLLMMYAINPSLIAAIRRLSDGARHALCAVLAAGFATDLAVSGTILSHVRRDNRVLDRDNTEEMAARVREAIAARGWAHRRLLDAFPQVRHIGHVIKQGAAEIRNTVVEGAAEIRNTVVESAAETRDRIADSAAGAKDFLSESAAGSRARLESELKKLEESHDRYEAEFQRRRAELQAMLDRYLPRGRS